MPQLTASVSQTGPLIQVIVGVSAPRAAALQAAKLPVPQSVKLVALLDTGASISAIDPTIIQQLGIAASGQGPVLSPTTGATPVLCNQFDVSIRIETPSLSRNWHALPVIESDLKAQGIFALIGRDVLSHCLMVFNGPDKSYTLAF